MFPYFSPDLAAYYLCGLRGLFGPANIRYTTRGFPTFARSGFLKFIVRGHRDYRVVIDSWDSPLVNDEAVKWCDVYGKMNLDIAHVPSDPCLRRKVVPTGPTFPVKWCSTMPALVHAAGTWLLCAKSSQMMVLPYSRARAHVASWLRQSRYGLPLERYEPGISRPDYIFFSSSIWKQDTETNHTRALFIEVCRDLKHVRFEGGFTPRTTSPVPGYDALTIRKRYTHTEFIENTKVSAIAFNNPAVERAFSWRLGESFALGKAIVSTPLEREVPGQLVHGRHIHFVEPSIPSIRFAVERICGDAAYRQTLEEGAREYYEKYLSPPCVIERLLQAA